jgi:NADH-quinone oxidoreductase subunit M
MLYSTLLIILTSTISEPYIELYHWQPIGDFGFKADGLSLPFALIIGILTTVLSIYSIPYMNHRFKEEDHGIGGMDDKAVNRKFGLYFALFLIYASGMIGSVFATNIIEFYIFFELMLVPSYLLIAEFGYGEKEKISFMYFIWTHVGALLLLAGLLSIGFLAGSFDIAQISSASIGVPLGVRTWIALAITLGLFVKLAAFGLHIWLPYAHAEAPTPISALLSPAMIGIGGYALIRFLLFILPSAFEALILLFGIWAVVTMIYGGLMALHQDDIKKLLAYSSVSQMGYIIFGISSAFYLGVTGSVFHYVSHGTGKAILFMAAGAIILQTNGLRSISKMGGLGGKLPITAICALIGFLAILGFPSLNGFQSEWMIFAGAFAGALERGSSIRLAISIIALSSTGLTIGYTLWAMKRIFFGKLPAQLSTVQEAPPMMTIPLLVLAFLTVVFGIFPSLIVDKLVPLIQQIFPIGG